MRTNDCVLWSEGWLMDCCENKGLCDLWFDEWLMDSHEDKWLFVLRSYRQLMDSCEDRWLCVLWFNRWLMDSSEDKWLCLVDWGMFVGLLCGQMTVFCGPRDGWWIATQTNDFVLWTQSWLLDCHADKWLCLADRGVVDGLSCDQITVFIGLRSAWWIAAKTNGRLVVLLKDSHADKWLRLVIRGGVDGLQSGQMIVPFGPRISWGIVVNTALLGELFSKSGSSPVF